MWHSQATQPSIVGGPADFDRSAYYIAVKTFDGFSEGVGKSFSVATKRFSV
jgi:hypothetical protein